MNVSVSQAMACGLPVIATRHSGLPEQVVDGMTGLLVPEGDWRALSRMIVELVDHPEHWADMGHKGKERVAQKYNNGVLLDGLAEIYRVLCKTTSENS